MCCVIIVVLGVGGVVVGGRCGVFGGIVVVFVFVGLLCYGLCCYGLVVGDDVWL